MKISFVTLYTPTPENVQGPSALNYYLLKYRNEEIDVEVFSFNKNDICPEELKQIEKELRVRIHIIELPFWFRFISNPKHKMTFLRVFLRKPLFAYINISNRTIDEIKHLQPDLIWWYPYFIYDSPLLLRQFKHIVTGPDCACLEPFRSLSSPLAYRSKLKYFGYWNVVLSSINFDKEVNTDNTLFHLVGMRDYNLLSQINQKARCFFLLHPHYALSNNIDINLQKNKIKIIIPGKKELYNQYDTECFIDHICRNGSQAIKDIYSFTFLGKGWEDDINVMVKNGYSCNQILWVEDYVESISQYDIQLSFITVGAGTKGKVLDAFANGLLVIGSDPSLENIAVRHNESCLLYKDITDVLHFLNDIPRNPQKYERIALRGMEQVRTYHNPVRISKRFFDIITKFAHEK